MMIFEFRDFTLLHRDASLLSHAAADALYFRRVLVDELGVRRQ